MVPSDTKASSLTMSEASSAPNDFIIARAKGIGCMRRRREWPRARPGTGDDRNGNDSQVEKEIGKLSEVGMQPTAQCRGGRHHGEGKDVSQEPASNTRSGALFSPVQNCLRLRPDGSEPGFSGAGGVALPGKSGAKPLIVCTELFFIRAFDLYVSRARSHGKSGKAMPRAGLISPDANPSASPGA